ncbi:heavy-metal-associated domain-containing protein [Kallotenue papyrolyticum]|uniref:heavy-metal-associated domain-containing protein n=1 Tax=Kallotenue papyrolyticum TaxID=1325125 RepID=UPI000478667C|nr:heavy metal-associated domain-containing protein [Kallotenue papyrolyticum]
MSMEFTVPSMSCQHCVNAITREVSNLPGVRQVKVDLGSKRVRVEAAPDVSPEAVAEAIREAGYDDVTLAR